MGCLRRCLMVGFLFASLNGALYKIQESHPEAKQQQRKNGLVTWHRTQASHQALRRRRVYAAAFPAACASATPAPAAVRV